MAQLKDTVVQGSLRVTDTTYTTNLNLLSANTYLTIRTDANKNLITGPIKTKTYTNITVTEDKDPAGWLYFFKAGRLSTATYNDIWKLTYKVTAYCAGQADSKQVSIVHIDGVRNTYVSYYTWNSVGNTSYRPFYAHIGYWASNNASAPNYAPICGLRFQSSYAPTNSTYARTITFDILEQENCDVTFFDNGLLYTNIPGTGSTYFGGRFSFDGTSLGITTSGDRNTTSISNLYNQYGGDIAATFIGRYHLVFEDINHKLVSFLTVDASTDALRDKIDKSLNTSVEFNPCGRIYYYNSTGTNAINTNIDPGRLFYAFLVDLRFEFNVKSPAATGTFTGTRYLPLYLKTLMNTNNGLVHVTDNLPLVTELPITQDNYYYIYLGLIHDWYRVMLERDHPVYYHNGTEIVRYYGYNASVLSMIASTYNGYTLNVASEYTVKDLSSNGAFTNSGTGLTTEKAVYYALASINNASQSRATSIYAPTSSGTSGHLLVASGSNNAPTWSANAYLIDESGSSVANKRNELVLGNATASASNGSSFGRLALYSENTAGTYLISASSTAWKTATLPAATGMLAMIENSTAKGSDTKPVKVAATGLITECNTYAGGTAVTLNGSNKGASTATFYAPTTSGTTNQILVSSGENNAPGWKATASGAAYATSSNGALTFGTLPVAQGGTNLTTITQGSIIYVASTTAYGCTEVGTSGHLLESNGTGAPSWILATDSNVASTIVKRNSSGNFSANIISSTLNGIIAYESTLTKGLAPTDDVLRFTYCSAYESGSGREAANRIGGLVEGLIDTNGRAGLVLRAYQHTANSTVDNHLVLYCDTSGTATYNVSNAYNFCKAIGAPLIKVVKFTSKTINSTGYTYTDSWITADTAVVATDLQLQSLVGIVEWTITAGSIKFTCATSTTLTFSIMMLKPCT